MKRIILFSQPTEKNSKKLFGAQFPKEIKIKTMAYMPANGRETSQKYTDFWENVAKKHGAKFVFIDNMKEGKEAEVEKIKIKRANILLITGGNTFELLYNLRKSGLDKAVLDFSRKKSCVLAGFSAGAIVLTPRIDIAAQPSGTDPSDFIDENNVGIKDLVGLNIINFEILPHYHNETDKKTLESYRKISPNEIRTVSDDELIIINN